MDIASTQVSITPDKKHVYITVNINEGEKYTIRDVKLTGDLKVPEEEVKRLLLVQKGQVFSRKVMTTTSDLITRRLGNEGYTFANVNGVPEAHDDDKTVSVTFVVDPGKRAYVNRINFRGNTKTEDEVLRREMRQMEGGWASTYLIDQSKARLSALATQGSQRRDPGGSRHRRPGRRQLQRRRATLRLDHRQRRLRPERRPDPRWLDQPEQLPGYRQQGQHRPDPQRIPDPLQLRLRRPYWTVDGVSLGYNAFYRKTDYDELDVDVASYSVNSLGAGMSIGYPISETSRLTYGLSVQRDQIDTGRYTVDEIYDFLDKEGDNFTNFKASIGWSESTLNKGVLATRGHSQSLTLETTLPGSDLSFYKIDYRGQVFAPLTDNYTMRFHTELGYGDGYGSTERLPFYENYYAGGFNSVRGFKDSTLGPRSTSRAYKDGKIIPGPDERGRYTDPDQDPEAFGGNILITGGAELLFPLPFVKDQRQLRTVLFWDVGSTFDTDCPTKTTTNCDGIKTDNLASSVGVGLTWITALGPLSFSLATPIKKPDNAETQVFQFSLGQTF